MKKLVMLSICLLPLLSFSQKKDKDEVMKVVTNVFEAMRTSDSTLLKSCFTDDPYTFTIFRREGETNFVKGEFQKFVNAVGSPKEKIWNEPIWNEKVNIDDDLASVWVDYAFYVDDQFSHCGVDAFHLVKLEGTWKIFHLVDTRRKNDCDIPDDIKP